MERSVSVPVYLAGEIEEPGTDAIEVIAMQGEQVHEVTHLTNPNGGQVTRTTWLMLGSGAAAALAALVIFFLTVAKEAAAKGAFDEFVRRGGAADKFAWPHVSAALDFFAIAFLAYAIDAAIRGLRRRADERAPRDFTIGTAPGVSCTVAAGLVPGSEMPLVRARDGGWDVVTCAGMTGEIEQGLSRQPLVGGSVVPLPHGTRVVIDAGSHRFFVRATARPRSHAQPILGGVRWDEQTYLAGSAIAHVLILIGLLSVPRDARALNQDDLPEIIARANVRVMAKEEKDDLSKILAKISGDAKVEGVNGQRMAGDESLAGSPKSKEHGKSYAIKGPAKNPDPGMPKRLINDIISSTGAVAVLGDHSASSIGSIYGKEGVFGNDAIDAFGELKPGPQGDAWGQGGWGNKPGTGKGGGGTGYGTVGLARIGTKGIYGSGDTTYGGHVGGLNKHRAGVPDAQTPGMPVVRGRLEKEIIKRIIRRHINEVKYCYEQEVLTHPGIEGRVVAQFTIAGNGTVSSSAIASSTVGDAAVDHCVANAVRRWEFPQPQGGGIVIVSYPFVLTLSGT